MLKICVVYSFKPSAWVSCQKIVANLVKAYEANIKEFELIPIHYATDIDDYEFMQSGIKARDAKPDMVVFLDHKPHPANLLNWLVREFDDIGHDPSYVFHLYGDFTLFFKKWAITEKMLANRKVLWYAASERQKAMLTEFIDQEQIKICPFPIDPKEFGYDPKLRAQFRKEQNWQDDETIFLFTGRLSRQKRIHQLIKTFADWRKKSQAKARLILVGDCDKLGEPWLLKGEYEGEYFHYLQEVMEKIPESEKKHIEFHGFKPNKFLRSYYNGADCLVNISVHNDEDYGMSCAEALACGLPLILTDWAGFQGFMRPEFKNEIKFVPVRLSPKAKQIHLRRLVEHFDFMLREAKSFDRKFIEETSLKWTSVANAASIVIDNQKHLKTFIEFNPNLHEATYLEAYNKTNTFTDMKKHTFNPFYMQVYRHYVGQA